MSSVAQTSGAAERLGAPATDYHGWLELQRRLAEENGGRAIWPPSARQPEERSCISMILPRATGEILNPLTGEVVTDCLSLLRVAHALDITTAHLANSLASMGWLQPILSWREVPMICQPALRKPRYFCTHAVTDSALWNGFLIPIDREGAGHEKFILITPIGQKELMGQLSGKPTDTQLSASQAKREGVRKLLQSGLKQSHIATMMGLPKQTVSRYAKAFRQESAIVPF